MHNLWIIYIFINYAGTASINKCINIFTRYYYHLRVRTSEKYLLEVGWCQK